MFSGETYDPKLDKDRLQKQLARVKDFLLSARGGWVELQNCPVALEGEGTAAITARARDLRKSRFGGYTVECRRKPGSKSLFEYRIPWEGDEPVRGKEHIVAKLFNLKKGTKEGVCNANRCKDEDVTKIPGDLWGILEVELCDKHLDAAMQHAEAAEQNGTTPTPPPKPEPGKLTSAGVNDEQLSLAIKPYVEEGEVIVGISKDYQIETHDDLETVAKWIAEVKLKRNEIERMEKEITGPLNTALQRVRSLFRPAKTYWADAEKLLKAKVAAAKLLEEQRNRQALKEAADAHSEGDTEGTVAAISKVTTVGDVRGVSTTSQWTFVIEDESKLPREFLQPNLKLIKEHCAHSTDREPTPIPGVKFVPDVRVSVTPSKVLSS